MVVLETFGLRATKAHTPSTFAAIAMAMTVAASVGTDSNTHANPTTKTPMIARAANGMTIGSGTRKRTSPTNGSCGVGCSLMFSSGPRLEDLARSLPN